MRRTNGRDHTAALLCCAALLAAGCSAPPAETPDDAAIRVAVSVPPQAYFVDRVGGARVRTEVLVPPGASPATYALSPRQMLELAGARLYVKVGHPDFPFEKKHLDAILDHHPQLEVVDMSEGMTFLPLDPHVWLAPATAERAARRIAQTLEDLDPEHAGEYGRNLEAFLADLEALDDELRTAFADLGQRRFLVQHPAWGCFAAEYGLEQVAIEHDGKSPSPAALVALIEEARGQGVRVVFVQRGFSDQSARIVARELGARVVELDPLAYDWLDNLRRVAAVFREALRDDEVS